VSAGLVWAREPAEWQQLQRKNCGCKGTGKLYAGPHEYSTMSMDAHFLPAPDYFWRAWCKRALEHACSDATHVASAQVIPPLIFAAEQSSSIDALPSLFSAAQQRQRAPSQ
jgi:hypothetical protein